MAAPSLAAGWLFGAHMGVNRQFAAWVLGGELSGNVANIRGSNACFGDFTAGTCTNEVNWFALGMGKLGYSFGNWMLYGQGGVAAVNLTTGKEAVVIPQGFQRGDAIFTGGAAGVGPDYAVTPDFILGVDYAHLFIDRTKTRPTTTSLRRSRRAVAAWTSRAARST